MTSRPSEPAPLAIPVEPDDARIETSRSAGSLYRSALVQDGNHAVLGRLCVMLDAEAEPRAFHELLDDALNLYVDGDGRAHPLAAAVLVHWPSARECVLYVPQSLAHRAILERARVLEDLDAVAEAPEYLGKFSTVVGLTALRLHLQQRKRAGLRGETERRGASSSGEAFRGSLGETASRLLEGPQQRSLRLYTSINVEQDPSLVEQLLNGMLNVDLGVGVASPAAMLPIVLHAPSARLFVLYLPESLAPRRRLEQARLLRQLAQAGCELPDYVLGFHTVVGRDALRALIEPSLARTVERPSTKHRSTQSYQTRLGLEPATRLQPELSSHNASSQLLSFFATLPHVFPGATEQRSYATLDPSQRLLVAFRCDPAAETAWLGRPWRLLLQLHNLDLYPLAALVLVALDHNELVALEHFHCFDAANPVHRNLLDGLVQRFTVNVALYSEGGLLLDGARFHGPLEANVRTLLGIADERFVRDTKLDLGKATQRFGERSFPRIGSMAHPFTLEALEWASSARDAQLAVSILNYWVQPPNQRYLVFNHSFSLSLFEEIRRRVIERALGFGIRLPTALRRLASQLLERTPEVVLRQSLSAFAELSVGLKPNDLDAFAAWENWRLLLEDAEELGVPVDGRVLELAREALAAAQRHEEAEEALPRVPRVRRRVVSSEQPALDLELHFDDGDEKESS